MIDDQIIEGLLEKYKSLKDRVDHLERLEQAMADNYGYIGGNWQKDPIRLGYSGDQSQQVTDTGSGGSDTLNGATVPAGEIWIVQAIGIVNTTHATSAFERIIAIVNGIGVVLKENASPASNRYTYWTGAVVLSPGDNIRANFSNTTAGDSLYLQYHAVRVDIDQ